VKEARGQWAALEAARRAMAAELPHEQAKIEGARVDQQAFELGFPIWADSRHRGGVERADRPSVSSSTLPNTSTAVISGEP
jgi:hypothetical protein